ncbi:DUF4396 domain-containing protein [Micromonospora sp. WMMD812]|uniref:DUF4396 domain-containing protein n=1 Tax=Micromonospora sp. WMMD812 TaxID=3015152 RepID=UPI00248B561F|nr:DUF4396 domain-containing protein [Micromonospora sp. WMMD812]WBB70571.1 DUF4396 domain-containing protein [Micromonospora sp. WMMD812]
MGAGLTDPLFWGALAGALAVAFLVTVPVNRALIARRRGHAVTHRFHHGAGDPAAAGHPTGPGHDAPGVGHPTPAGHAAREAARSGADAHAAEEAERSGADAHAGHHRR